MTPLYLGLDSSTQSLTGLVLEVDGTDCRVAFRQTLNFDADFPHYDTRNGVLPQTEPLVATSSPAMWAEALEQLVRILVERSDLDLSQLRAVSGAAQQHGSVYLSATAGATLGTLDPATPLAKQVSGMLSRSDAPIWMDSSTAADCAAITEALGGDATVQRVTGSRAFERFTGAQIHKLHRLQPAIYADTGRIHLVSSFLASLLIGRHAPIDHGDGSGMNLMDLRTKQWSDVALRATAPDLASKLPSLCPPWAVVGVLAPYWTDRYGLPPARVVAWTGDNPSSLIGVGLADPSHFAISLGTSDTVFGLLAEPRVDPSGASHVFVAPTGDYMALVCFKNGSLARERVRDDYGLDWVGFSQALRDTPPGNHGRVLLPWLQAEITPPMLKPGVRRFGLDERDGPANVRAVVEAQMLATALHSAWMGQRVERIHATGGAAQNHDILQVMADVHDAEVSRFESTDSVALGAALRAWHGDRAEEGTPISWPEVVGAIQPTVADSVRPIARNVVVYRELAKVYAACEAQALGRGEDPTPLLERFRATVNP